MTKSKGDSQKVALYCSFCGKSQHEVQKLIAGPRVFICDECVELCIDIIDTDKAKRVRDFQGRILTNLNEVAQEVRKLHSELSKVLDPLADFPEKVRNLMSRISEIPPASKVESESEKKGD